MTHPLTHEICKELSCFPFEDCDGVFDGLIHDMRAAYDKGAADTLERVIKWLKATKSTVKLCPSVLAVQLEQAMREDWEDIQTAIERKDSVPVPTTLDEMRQQENN